MTLLVQAPWESDEQYESRVEQAEAASERRAELRKKFTDRLAQILGLEKDDEE